MSQRQWLRERRNATQSLADVDVKFSEAKGYRVGAGVKLGITSVNLEYQNLTYDKTKLEEAGVFSPGYSRSDVELENSSWILSVSFPIAI